MHTDQMNPNVSAARAHELKILHAAAGAPGGRGVEARIRLAMGDELRTAIILELARGTTANDLIFGLSSAFGAMLATLVCNLEIEDEQQEQTAMGLGQTIGIGITISHILQKQADGSEEVVSNSITVTDTGEIVDLGGAPVMSRQDQVPAEAEEQGLLAVERYMRRLARQLRDDGDPDHGAALADAIADFARRHIAMPTARTDDRFPNAFGAMIISAMARYRTVEATERGLCGDCLLREVAADGYAFSRGMTRMAGHLVAELYLEERVQSVLHLARLAASGRTMVRDAGAREPDKPEGPVQ